MTGKARPTALFLTSIVWIRIALSWVCLSHSWIIGFQRQAWGIGTVLVFLPTNDWLVDPYAMGTH